METEIAPAYPFVRDDSGNFPIASEYDLMEMEIEQALKIKFGSHPMWKSIGTRFDLMLFENDIDTKQGLAFKLVKDTVIESVPNCIIEDVGISKDNEEEGIYYIQITYKKTNDSTAKSFVVTMRY